MGNNGKLFDIRISRPLDPDATERTTEGFKSVREIVEDVMAKHAEVDEEICRAVGLEMADSGAGFGMRDLAWFALEWSVVENAARRALELPIRGLQVSISNFAGTIQ